MGGIEWHLGADVAAAPEAVFAWLTDYRPDDHARPAFLRGAGGGHGGEPGARREVIRSDGGTIELRDSWGRKRFTSRVTIDREGRSLTIRGDFGYRATWTARPTGEGTRVEVQGAVRPGAVGSLFLRLVRRSFLREMEADFRGHMEDLREELARPPEG